MIGDRVLALVAGSGLEFRELLTVHAQTVEGCLIVAALKEGRLVADPGQQIKVTDDRRTILGIERVGQQSPEDADRANLQTGVRNAGASEEAASGGDDFCCRQWTRVAEHLHACLGELTQTSRPWTHVAEAGSGVVELVGLRQVVELTGGQQAADGSGQLRT